jgi:hypothetical protein
LEGGSGRAIWTPTHRKSNGWMMKRLFGSLKESDRRRYAAIEAAKLGHGGIEYIADVLGCDPKTIRLGLGELEGKNDLDTGRSRKKGAGGNG